MDGECPPVRLLPDAQRGALAFSLCRTQWMHAPNGRPTGLRAHDCMAVLRANRKRFNVPVADLDDWFADLQAMEHAYVQAVRDVMAAEDEARIGQQGGQHGHQP